MPDACYALLAATTSGNKPQILEALAIGGTVQAKITGRSPYFCKITPPPIKILGTALQSQQHTTFTALLHGLLISNISNELSPLNDMLKSKLLPAITGRPSPLTLSMVCSPYLHELQLGIRILKTAHCKK